MKPLPQSIKPQLKKTATTIYSKYLKPQALFEYGTSKRSGNSCVTIYSCAFVHSYLVCCTSNGMICVWDGDNGSKRFEVGQKRSYDELGGDGCRPIVCVQAVSKEDKNSSLYDIQYIPNKDLLIVSGDPGVFVYKWSDFQSFIQQQQSLRQTVDIRPAVTFHPHSSPCETIEINSTSYDVDSNILYAASGDGFGCYQWDFETEQLLGTFGRGKSGHTDYLHVVKVVDGGVITGSEDGKMGFWNGQRKLIQLYDIQSTMDKNKQLVTGQSTNRGFLNNSSIWSSGCNLWVSSIEPNGNWLAVGGGAEYGHNGITARSSSTPATSGFLTTWHLPTRSFSSGCVTRESINAITYNPSLDMLVTGANEGRISYWESTSAKRVGRAWCSSSATYALSVSSESGKMVAGGCGGVVDCFVDRVRISQLRL